MVLSATDALTLTNSAITETFDSSLQSEVFLTEKAIRTATQSGLTRIRYNAKIVGNPAGDPFQDGSLTDDLQVAYRDAFADAGYFVGYDGSAASWSFDWSSTGAETQVRVYSFRTSLTQTGDVTPDTTDAISAYFSGLLPAVHVRTAYNGNIDETIVGGAASVVYEWTIIADQSNSTNYATELLSYLRAQGIGYIDGNSSVLLMV